MLKKVLIGTGLVGVGFVAGYLVCKMVEDTFHQNIFDEDDFDDLDDFDEDLDDDSESVSEMIDNFANTMKEEDGDK